MSSVSRSPRLPHPEDPAGAVAGAAGTGGRERILARVRSALTGVPGGERPGDVPVPRDDDEAHCDGTPADLLDLLAERVADYRAEVHRCTEDELPALLARVPADRGGAGVAVPPGLPPRWLGALEPAGGRTAGSGNTGGGTARGTGAAAGGARSPCTGTTGG